MKIDQNFSQLEAQLKRLKPVLAKAADAIMDQDISTYPIFVAFKGEAAIGLPLIEQEEAHWSVNASTLEEFTAKGLIAPEMVDDFRQVYKDSEKTLCVFVVENATATFVFLPRK